MKYTNKHNFPIAVYNALSKDTYSPGTGDYSVTTLLKPPQMVQLERRYSDQITEDVVDRVWSLMGQAAHSILEGHGHDESITEERFYAEVLGRKIGGQVDNYHEGVITDYKITSVWTLVYDRNSSKWEEQLNLYAYLFRQNGYEVNHLQVVAILRDWDKNRALRDKSYPQTPIVIVPLNLWSDTKQEAFIHEKVYLHSCAENLSDEELAEGYRCTPEETWEKPSTWAVMKVGRKTAVRVFPTYDEAIIYELGVDQNPDNPQYYIEERPGSRIRCSQYCSVSKWCCQYQQYLKEQENQ